MIEQSYIDSLGLVVSELDTSKEGQEALQKMMQIAGKTQKAIDQRWASADAATRAKLQAMGKATADTLKKGGVEWTPRFGDQDKTRPDKTTQKPQGKLSGLPMAADTSTAVTPAPAPFAWLNNTTFKLASNGRTVDAEIIVPGTDNITDPAVEQVVKEAKSEEGSLALQSAAIDAGFDRVLPFTDSVGTQLMSKPIKVHVRGFLEQSAPTPSKGAAPSADQDKWTEETPYAEYKGHTIRTSVPFEGFIEPPLEWPDHGFPQLKDVRFKTAKGIKKALNQLASTAPAKDRHDGEPIVFTVHMRLDTWYVLELALYQEHAHLRWDLHGTASSAMKWAEGDQRYAKPALLNTVKGHSLEPVFLAPYMFLPTDNDAQALIDIGVIVNNNHGKIGPVQDPPELKQLAARLTEMANRDTSTPEERSKIKNDVLAYIKTWDKGIKALGKHHIILKHNTKIQDFGYSVERSMDLNRESHNKQGLINTRHMLIYFDRTLRRRLERHAEAQAQQSQKDEAKDVALETVGLFPSIKYDIGSNYTPDQERRATSAAIRADINTLQKEKRLPESLKFSVKKHEYSMGWSIYITLKSGDFQAFMGDDTGILTPLATRIEETLSSLGNSYRRSERWETPYINVSFTRSGFKKNTKGDDGVTSTGTRDIARIKEEGPLAGVVSIERDKGIVLGGTSYQLKLTDAWKGARKDLKEEGILLMFSGKSTKRNGSRFWYARGTKNKTQAELNEIAAKIQRHFGAHDIKTRLVGLETPVKEPRTDATIIVDENSVRLTGRFVSASIHHGPGMGPYRDVTGDLAKTHRIIFLGPRDDGSGTYYREAINRSRKGQGPEYSLAQTIKQTFEAHGLKVIVDTENASQHVESASQNSDLRFIASTLGGDAYHGFGAQLEGGYHSQSHGEKLELHTIPKQHADWFNQRLASGWKVRGKTYTSKASAIEHLHLVPESPDVVIPFPKVKTTATIDEMLRSVERAGFDPEKDDLPETLLSAIDEIRALDGKHVDQEEIEYAIAHLHEAIDEAKDLQQQKEHNLTIRIWPQDPELIAGDDLGNAQRIKAFYQAILKQRPFGFLARSCEVETTSLDADTVSESLKNLTKFDNHLLKTSSPDADYWVKTLELLSDAMIPGLPDHYLAQLSQMKDIAQEGVDSPQAADSTLARLKRAFEASFYHEAKLAHQVLKAHLEQALVSLETTQTGLFAIKPSTSHYTQAAALSEDLATKLTEKEDDLCQVLSKDDISEGLTRLGYQIQSIDGDDAYWYRPSTGKGYGVQSFELAPQFTRVSELCRKALALTTALPGYTPPIVAPEAAYLPPGAVDMPPKASCGCKAKAAQEPTQTGTIDPLTFMADLKNDLERASNSTSIPKAARIKAKLAKIKAEALERSIKARSLGISLTAQA